MFQTVVGSGDKLVRKNRQPLPSWTLEGIGVGARALTEQSITQWAVKLHRGKVLRAALGDKGGWELHLEAQSEKASPGHDERQGLDDE